MYRVAPLRRPRRATVGILVLGLAVLSVVGVAGWSYWLCDDATYHCPANGCGAVPQENCRASVGLLTVAIAVGGVAAAVGALLFVWPGPPQGRPVT